MSLKQIFCEHIWKLEKEEYNYSTYRVVLNFLTQKYEHYIQYYKCVKCDKEKIEEIAIEKSIDNTQYPS